MNARLQSLLITNGALVFLLGLVAGFPFALVALGNAVPWPWQMPGDVRAWRMAHLEGILNGLTLFAVAAVGPRLTLGERAHALLAWSLVVTAWGNIIASLIGPIFGGRGLEPGGGVANDLMYVLFVVAVGTVIVAMVLVCRGARRTLTRR